MRLTRLALAAFVAGTALPSGVALVVARNGADWLPLRLLEPTPFASFLIPGLLLGVAVGGSALVAAIAEGRGARGAARASLAAGSILLGWMIGEVLLLREFSWLQPLYFLVALAQIALAWSASFAAGADRLKQQLAERFFAHPRLAFVGLSSHTEDFSHAVAKAFLARGIEVVPVNPNVEGAWPRVSAIPEPPPAVLLMVPPDKARAVVADAIAAGAKAVWFHRGLGAGSASDDAVQLAEDAGLLVVRDACPLMFLDPVHVHRAHRVVRRSAWSTS